MQTIQTPITGYETRSLITNPHTALLHFYHAFNEADLTAMSDNWEHSGEIAMDNPVGGIKRGWDEIQSVYQKIFHGPARVYVEFYDYSIHETAELFYAVGRERGYFQTRDIRIDLAIRTSRIYRKTPDGWKQVHHHGSIEDPVLLDTYQTTIRQMITQTEATR